MRVVFLDLEKQKLMAAEYRYKLVDMMGELYRYIQPSQLDKVFNEKSSLDQLGESWEV